MILLDTQVVVWFVARPARLPRSARRAIAKAGPSGGLAIASVTLMELAELASRGDVRIPGTPHAWLRQLVEESGLVIRELTTEIAAVAAYLPPSFPSDPFDRLIAATAISGRMALVTSDARIRRCGVVKTIW